MLIKTNELVLFQGDSITDAGRDRTQGDNLGWGYAALVAARFSAMHPQVNARFLNRGISGNRAVDLRGRWETDCLSLRPDWVSILIGINDTWRRYDSNDPTPVEVFYSNFRSILVETKANGIKILILEPFLLPVPEDRMGWRVDLDPKIQAARVLAREFADVLVPLDGIFAHASVNREPSFWLPDGVHPSLAGHAIIAQAWLKAIEVG